MKDFGSSSEAELVHFAFVNLFKVLKYIKFGKLNGNVRKSYTTTAARSTLAFLWGLASLLFWQCLGKLYLALILTNLQLTNVFSA